VDVGEMQKKLSQWATEDSTKRFVDLYSLLCNEVWLRVAANATLKNKGSGLKMDSRELREQELQQSSQ
jgi:hypothetical protein